MNKLYLETFKTNDLQDLKETLGSIASDDFDMNGDNGEEYLWDCAKELGCENNIDYLMKTVKGDNIRDIVGNFFNKWLYYDGYYIDYDWDKVELGDTTVLTVVLVTED